MILTTGSLAYDYIMGYQGNFAQHIAPNSERINVSFVTNSFLKHRGGTSGNIAYNLKLLGASPLLVATAGYDFEDYKKSFDRQGINTEEVEMLDDEVTASAFVTSDTQENQIVLFHPGAMAKAALKDLEPMKEKIKMAIIAPEMKETMMHYCKECKRNNIPYFFDPGQNIPMFSAEELMECLQGAYGFIANDYEWQLVQKSIGMTPEELVATVDYVVITEGDKGSKIYTTAQMYSIEAFAPHEVQDPTGCGDAYRAGLLSGLVEGLSIEAAGKRASLAATYCVEEHGTQNHHYTMNEFIRRIS